jgi:hypothetical protein
VADAPACFCTARMLFSRLLMEVPRSSGDAVSSSACCASCPSLLLSPRPLLPLPAASLAPLLPALEAASCELPPAAVAAVDFLVRFAANSASVSILASCCFRDPATRPFCRLPTQAFVQSGHVWRAMLVCLLCAMAVQM